MTTPRTEIQITKTTPITVDLVSTNSYGDLQFTDTQGTNYKIGAKRAKLFDGIVLAGATINLNYTPNLHKQGEEYIYSARATPEQTVNKVFPKAQKEPVEIEPENLGDFPEPAKPPPKETPKPPPQVVQSISTPFKAQVKEIIHTDPKNRAFALSYAKDIQVALISSTNIGNRTDLPRAFTIDELLTLADKFVEWLNK